MAIDSHELHLVVAHRAIHHDFQNALSGARREHDHGGRVQLLATLSVALCDLSLAIALCLAAIVLIPAAILSNMGLPNVIPAATILVMTVWGGSMTYLHRTAIGAFALGIVAPLNIAAVVFQYSPFHQCLENQALVWTVVAALLLVISSVGNRQWLKLMRRCSQCWLVAMGALSLTATDPNFRIIGLTAVAAISMRYYCPTSVGNNAR